jgi:uncharacterized protein with HEPN domain
MYHLSLFEIIRKSGEAVLDLVVEMQGADELFASANTLQTIEDHLLVMSNTMAHLPPILHLRLPQVDWTGWGALHHALRPRQEPRRDIVWYAVCALVPATLVLLDKLQRREPELFEILY